MTMSEGEALLVQSFKVYSEFNDGNENVALRGLTATWSMINLY